MPSNSSAQAAEFGIVFLGNGDGYSLQYNDHDDGGKYLSIDAGGKLDVEAGSAAGFQIYSVSYHD